MSRMTGRSEKRSGLCNHLPFYLALFLALCSTAANADSPIDAKSLAASEKFFESEIRPLLIESCLKCHGAEKQEGGLRLDSRESLLTGGDSGPAIEVGKAAESLIVSAVKHDGLEMPPNKRLDDEQIELLARWIDSGAVWPESKASGLDIRRQKTLSDDDRNYWAFRPITKVAVPNVNQLPDRDRCINDIDAFIIARLASEGLTLAPPAEPQQLLRRVTFDVLGVPPTAAESAGYAKELATAQANGQPEDQVYAALVNRLLDDPRYGERAARHWLDVVRYAESDGFKQDAYRPAAHLYRDYVIDALNRDLPYDQFVTEQLAADEMPEASARTLAATGYLRHWIYEYNQRDVRTQWSNILNDLTDVTGELFLGMSVGCARCHDHKFDPILQKDYFRLQASFAAFMPHDNTPWGEAEQLAQLQTQQSAWEQATASIREEMRSLEQPVRDRVAAKAIDKFPPDVRPLLRLPVDQRSPYENQLADLAFRQVTSEWTALDFSKQLKDADKERWIALNEKLKEFDRLKPSKNLAVMAATETGPQAPPTFIPPLSASSEPIVPATLEVLGGQPIVATVPPSGRTTGRRTALARWLNDPTNPLPHRVIVNRLWQMHFGTGLVANSSDFGRLGSPPSHPELLDYLSSWWLENGRSMKKLHRLILTSATYRQSSQHPERESFDLIDHENRTLWHFPTRRLDAEQVRDAMLVASGAIEWKSGGPASEHAAYRRSIYTKVMRNTPDPLLNVLDAPDGTGTIAKRSVTTTAVQSLLLANSPWPLKLSKEMAAYLRTQKSSTDEQIQLAFQQCFARDATPDELREALTFLDDQMQRSDRNPASSSPTSDKDDKATNDDKATSEKSVVEKSTAEKSTAERVSVDRYSQALADLCHVLLNSSEFLYVD